MRLQEFVARLGGARCAGGEWTARCPAHEDARASLTVAEGSDGKVLVRCHAGCSTADIVRALGLTMRDLFPDRERPRASGKKIVATYGYTDEHGTLLYQVLRYAPKTFRQRRPDGNGGWTWRLDGVRRVLYHLPALLGSTGPVLVVEGEKDVEALRGLGLVATSNPGGAGKWRPEYSAALRGRDVTIIADADEPGRKHAQDVARHLSGTAASVRVLEVPGARDSAEWIEQGHTVEELRALVGAAPERMPEADAAEPARDEPSNKRGPNQASRLIALVEQSGAELFRGGDGRAYATVRIDGHRETWALGSRVFRNWLAAEQYGRSHTAVGREAVTAAIAVLEARALREGPEHPVAVRVGGDGTRDVWLDLGDPSWRAAHVTAHGWQVVADPPIRFIRARGTLALPEPAAGGALRDLRRFLNVGEDGWALVAAWLVAALRPRGPYPLLELHGEAGTGKTTAGEILQELIDPNVTRLRAEPRDARDLIIAARGTWLLAYDNLSTVRRWLSDCLCRTSTGCGFATRELYSDDEEVLFTAMRPVLLTGIEDLATRGDLLDRTLLLSLEPIREEARRPLDGVWEEFALARPRILGALLDAVVVALRRLPTVRPERLPRMADFARWAIAAEPGLGLEPGAFLGAYDASRVDASRTALAGSPIAAELLRLAKHGWSGTVRHLLRRLEEAVDDGIRRSREWPTSPRELGGDLRRLAPDLRAVGVEVEIDHTRERTRVTLRCPSGPSAPQSAPPSALASPRPSPTVTGPSPENPCDHEACDGGDGGDGSSAPWGADSDEPVVTL